MSPNCSDDKFTEFRHFSSLVSLEVSFFTGNIVNLVFLNGRVFQSHSFVCCIITQCRVACE